MPYWPPTRSTGVPIEVRHDMDGETSYTGSALASTGDAEDGWKVTRIIPNTPPSIAHGEGAWADRLTLTYT